LYPASGFSRKSSPIVKSRHFCRRLVGISPGNSSDNEIQTVTGAPPPHVITAAICSFLHMIGLGFDRFYQLGFDDLRPLVVTQCDLSQEKLTPRFYEASIYDVTCKEDRQWRIKERNIARNSRMEQSI